MIEQLIKITVLHKAGKDINYYPWNNLAGGVRGLLRTKDRSCIKKAPFISERGFLEFLVPVGGLEPPRPKATDFESVVYTNFTTPALHNNN